MGVERPLEGMLVLDFSQFLAGPLAGFDYPVLRNINLDLIYGSISGYGDKGPWVKRPG